MRVEMEYDAAYDVPADAQAVVVTPTLVADRYVQLTPAYTGGEVLADGAEIDLRSTAVPVELDRIFASLVDLSEALGPNGVNEDGSLNELLVAGRAALKDNGGAGNAALKEMAAAAETFGDGSGIAADGAGFCHQRSSLSWRRCAAISFARPEPCRRSI